MIGDLLTTAATYAAAIGLTGALSPPAIAVAGLKPGGEDLLLRMWARGILGAARVHAKVEGLQNLPEGPAVLVCNHQSHFDVVMIMAHLWPVVRFIGKESLFRIPLFGHALRATGSVSVDRTGGERDRESLRIAAERIRERRLRILFFAEGTRSEDGQLRRFKKGGAVFAIQGQVPIVPLAIAGTREVLRKGSAWVHGGKPAALCVGAPISTEGLSGEDREALTLRMEASVRELLAQAEARIRA